MPKRQTDSGAALRTFAGKTFLLAGKFSFFHADSEIPRLIAVRGGRVVGKLTESLDYLVLGRTNFGAVKKETQALNQKKGAAIQIIDEAGCFAMMSPTREEAIALLNEGKPGVAAWEHLIGDGDSIRWPDLSGADLRKVHVPDDQIFLDLKGLRLDGAD